MSSYHRVEVVTKFEKLVVAVIVSAVFFATAILLVSVVVLFISIFAAIIVVVATAELRIELDVKDSRRIDPRHESSPRRRATDRRARAESSSSIESDRFDATVVRREGSDSASYVRLHRRDSDPPRHANYSPTADATLLVPQPSNPAPPDSVLSALLL